MERIKLKPPQNPQVELSRSQNGLEFKEHAAFLSKSNLVIIPHPTPSPTMDKPQPLTCLSLFEDLADGGEWGEEGWNLIKTRVLSRIFGMLSS